MAAEYRQRQLKDLLAGIDVQILSGESKNIAEIVISGICQDSREIKSDSLFVAIAGTISDGHRYLADVVAKGCRMIMVEKDAEYALPADWNGCLLEVADTRKAYATLAENWFERPAEKMTLVAVTGTNGKTTISYLLEDILSENGDRVGVIGTVNYRYMSAAGEVVLPASCTTPDALRLQELLAEMFAAGVRYVIMEVSSHALWQHRIGNILFDVAIFTNLSRDHLDYHGSMEAYFAAKALLFAEHLKDQGTAVLAFPSAEGQDTQWAGRLDELCLAEQRKILRAGGGENCQVQLLEMRPTLAATTIDFRVAEKRWQLKSPLVGHFNVDNLLTAIAASYALGRDVATTCEALTKAHGAPGRLQRVSTSLAAKRLMVFVDYAHTPDALQQVLSTLQALPHRELFCVVGCGGDRDAGKRPVMGNIAGRFADVVILTDDNPRNENPDSIRHQVVPGILEAGLPGKEKAWLKIRQPGERGFVEIGRREIAIYDTVCAATEGDIVLIAGKGHEKYQITAQGKRFFDDCLEAERGLFSWNCDMLATALDRPVSRDDRAARCFCGLTTDSRSLSPGEIFVALDGEKFDGHDFLDVAEKKGAGCLVVAEGRATDAAVPVIEVVDTLRALGDLAAYRRRLLAAYCQQQVIAITGSCGKTTVKEMTAAILRRKWSAGEFYPEHSVLQTKGNLNNLIGLPLSLLPLSVAHRAAVLELGMNVPGEIHRLTEICDPDICCITNVHGVHLEGLGSVEGVGDAKEELWETAKKDATFIVNLDDEQLCRRITRYSQRRFTFTLAVEKHDQADFWVSELAQQDPETMQCCLHWGSAEEKVLLHTVGEHNVANALAAAAIAAAAGATLREIAAGLGDFRPADRRMVISAGPKGTTVVNDTYNANPASMQAALATVAERCSGKFIAVLGDMLELGPEAASLHHELGTQVVKAGCAYLAAVGVFADCVVAGAREAGISEDVVRACQNKEQAIEWMKFLFAENILGKNDWILVKGSRGLQMETLVESLLEENN